jgi:uncharacterized protein YecE (DUF72 family)
MPSRSYLTHYSQFYNAVELDSTFYGTPPPERVNRWAAAVPDNFKFCVKTPRQITHESGLIDAIEEMRAFLDVVRQFGSKLGTVLIQLPPDFAAVNFDTIDTFLSKLPSDLQYAIEFRHESWFVGETSTLLMNHQVGWVSTDYLDLPKQIALTKDFLYIRWLGRHGQFTRKDHEQVDVMPQLQWWWEYIEPQINRIQTIYGFFNNDFSGHSPKTCNRFKELVGLPTDVPQIPQQRRLL